MYTLEIRNGDLVLAAGGYDTVTGPPKVGQDLEFAVGEPLGNDRFHPGWGSVLDTYIGLINSSAVAANCRAEISRVVNNYVAVQKDLVQQDASSGLRSRFSTGDLVGSIDSIISDSLYDSIGVTISLRTADQTAVTVDVSAGGTS